MRSSVGVAPAMRWLVNSVISRLPERYVNLDWVPRSAVRRQFDLSWTPHIELLQDMVRRHRGSDVRRLCRLALTVPEPIEPGCPVLSIHGTGDKILSYFEDEIDVPIHGAGHFISLTHPAEVNAAISNFIEMVDTGLWRESLYHTLLAGRFQKTV